MVDEGEREREREREASTRHEVEKGKRKEAAQLRREMIRRPRVSCQCLLDKIKYVPRPF